MVRMGNNSRSPLCLRALTTCIGNVFFARALYVGLISLVVLLFPWITLTLEAYIPI